MMPSEARQRAEKIVTEVAGRVMQARIGDASRDWSAVRAERKAEAVEAILPMLAAEVQRAVDECIEFVQSLAGPEFVCSGPDNPRHDAHEDGTWAPECIAAAIRARQRAGGS